MYYFLRRWTWIWGKCVSVRLAFIWPEKMRTDALGRTPLQKSEFACLKTLLCYINGISDPWINNSTKSYSIWKFYFWLGLVLLLVFIGYLMRVREPKKFQCGELPLTNATQKRVDYWPP